MLKQLQMYIVFITLFVSSFACYGEAISQDSVVGLMRLHDNYISQGDVKGVMSLLTDEFQFVITDVNGHSHLYSKSSFHDLITHAKDMERYERNRSSMIVKVASPTSAVFSSKLDEIVQIDSVTKTYSSVEYYYIIVHEGKILISEIHSQQK